jgi:hypothetical protein
MKSTQNPFVKLENVTCSELYIKLPEAMKQSSLDSWNDGAWGFPLSANCCIPFSSHQSNFCILTYCNPNTSSFGSSWRDIPSSIYLFCFIKVYILLLPGFGMMKYAEGGSVRTQVRSLWGQYMGLLSLVLLR